MIRKLEYSGNVSIPNARALTTPKGLLLYYFQSHRYYFCLDVNRAHKIRHGVPSMSADGADSLNFIGRDFVKLPPACLTGTRWVLDVE